MLDDFLKTRFGIQGQSRAGVRLNTNYHRIANNHGNDWGKPTAPYHPP